MGEQEMTGQFQHLVQKLHQLFFVDSSAIQSEAATKNHEHTQNVIFDGKSSWKSLFQFIGPSYMIAVGYMDPGNWSTDISAGAKFGYTHLCIVLLTSLMAMLFQSHCVLLGVVTRRDLAQQCKLVFNRPVNIVLYVLTEIAIMATDLAEVIGSAIALNLLFGLPLEWGVLITALDVLLILRWWGSQYQRVYEGVIFVLVLVVGICFMAQLFYTKPDFISVLSGFNPLNVVQMFTQTERLLIAIGIMGATVMPHNLYLHSSICQNLHLVHEDSVSGVGDGIQIIDGVDDIELDVQTSVNETSPSPASNNFQDSVRLTLRYATFDMVVALIFAFIVNATILIVGASAFYTNPDVRKDPSQMAELQDAHASLQKYIGSGAAALFAIALLASGQSSTITGTIAGQVVMNGFLNLRLKPVIRRLFTRVCAILPALITVLLYGQNGLNRLLVISQVILSCQLPFALIPLNLFVSSKEIMSGGRSLRLSSRFSWLSGILATSEQYRNLEQDNNPQTQSLNQEFAVSGYMLYISWVVTAIVVIVNMCLVISAIFIQQQKNFPLQVFSSAVEQSPTSQRRKNPAMVSFSEDALSPESGQSSGAKQSKSGSSKGGNKKQNSAKDLLKKPFSFVNAVTEVTGVNSVMRTTRGVLSDVTNAALNTFIGGSASDTDVQSVQQARKLANDIFNALLEPGKSEVTIDNFVPYFPSPDEARKAFRLFDTNGNGDIEKEEMKTAIEQFLNEKKAIETGVADLGTVVGRLDSFLLVITFIVVLFIWLSVFGVALTQYLLTFGSLIILSGVVIGNSAKTVVENILFLFVLHPFDVGDKIVVDGELYTVKNIALNSTTLVHVEGKLAKIPNAILQTKVIYNYRRSPNQSETFTLFAESDKVDKLMAQLEDEVTKFVRMNARDYLPTVSVHIDNNNGFADGKLKILLRINYKGNFQDIDVTRKRHNKAVMALREILSSSALKDQVKTG
ncbi:hypothetical protein MP228_001955 [Amoeboaphelidium protococcarum]|nr:hypothetical protein MP228_001955 [Amoeboaphelidium protococcarum]